MPFTRFVLPLSPPRLWGLFSIAALLLVVAVLNGFSDGQVASSWALEPGKVGTQPWRLLTWCLVQEGWVQAGGNAIGLGVGLTMMARCSGRIPAWTGLAGSILLPALWAWYSMEDPGAQLVGASTLLYGALGMGSGAWLKMRHELTYTQRSDWIAGLSVLVLVGFTLSIPVWLGAPARWIHVIGFSWGLGVALFYPRD